MAASQKRGAKQSAAAQRLRAESQKAAARADTAKRQVRLAKAVLKRARKLAKASKKAAKQARKKAKAQAAGKGGTTRDLLQPPARTSAKRKKPTVEVGSCPEATVGDTEAEADCPEATGG